MKSRFLLFFFCFLIVVSTKVAALDIALNTGYRIDKYSFEKNRIKQKWHKEKYWTFGLEGASKVFDRITLNGEVRYGQAYQDHFRQYPKYPWEVFKGRSKKNKAVDALFGVGYPLNFCDPNLTVIPQMGVNFHGFWLKVSKGRLHRRHRRHHKWKDFHHQHAKHEAYWKSPWVGFLVNYQVPCGWDVWFEYQHEFPFYNSKSKDLNFVDNAHNESLKASGQGNILRFGTSYDLSCDGVFYLQAEWWDSRLAQHHVRWDAFWLIGGLALEF